MSRVAANAAVRPSRRPNSRSTTGRATWVDTKRSVGEWKVPTFSAREWRSAALAALGANGSCTCTKSSSARSMNSSIERDTSSGSATEPPRRNGRLWPDAQHARAALVREGRGRVRAHIADPRPPLLDQRARLRRRHHHDPMPAPAQLIGEPLDVGVHLVVLLPGVGRDLGDRERTAPRHPAEADVSARSEHAG